MRSLCSTASRCTLLPHVANVHLDAVEHKDRIVFLPQLEGGPADRSYGIHVAHLAGIPRYSICVRVFATLAQTGPPASNIRDQRRGPRLPTPACMTQLARPTRLNAGLIWVRSIRTILLCSTRSFSRRRA